MAGHAGKIYMNTRCVTENLYIRNEDNEYSTSYKLLTYPFYLDKIN